MIDASDHIPTIQKSLSADNRTDYRGFFPFVFAVSLKSALLVALSKYCGLLEVFSNFAKILKLNCLIIIPAWIAGGCEMRILAEQVARRAGADLDHDLDHKESKDEVLLYCTMPICFRHVDS